jgi:hypothetical protein
MVTREIKESDEGPTFGLGRVINFPSLWFKSDAGGEELGSLSNLGVGGHLKGSARRFPTAGGTGATAIGETGVGFSGYVVHKAWLAACSVIRRSGSQLFFADLDLWACFTHSGSAKVCKEEVCVVRASASGAVEEAKRRMRCMQIHYRQHTRASGRYHVSYQ